MTNESGLGRCVPIRPYKRARDLEVLLLSSASPTFTGMVVPGDSLATLKPWISSLPKAWGSPLRPDVLGAVELQGELKAVPFTLDGVVIVYRRDWWALLNLPPPTSMAAIGKAARTLRSWRPALVRPVRSQIPAEELFWDLAWSYEGNESPQVYTYPKLKALNFLQEFGLSSSAARQNEAVTALTGGKAALVFVRAGTAGSLLKGKGGKGERFSVAPIPSRNAAARVIYNGWCMVRPLVSGRGPKGWTTLLSPAFQRRVVDNGFFSVLKSGVEGGDAAIDAALDKTRFCASPDLGYVFENIVYGAVMDATEASLPPEEALRRAEARIRDRNAKP